VKTSLKEPTSRQLRRWRHAQDIGCVACILDGVGGVPGDVHHVLSGGRRVSHDATVVLCPWHHRGVLPSGRKADEFAEVHGPSLAHTPNAFKRRYGSDEELLEIQDALIAHYLEVTTGDDK